MGLTHYALELMGYRRKREDEALQAQFSSVHAFEVQGLGASTGLMVAHAGSVAGVSYRLALAETLNVAAQAVASDDFADDEPAWVAEHKCSPPYLLLYVGPTGTHRMSGEFVKEDRHGLHTHDAFIPAREELREMEAKVIPAVISALSCVLGTLPNPVRFRQIERAVSGKTIDGRTLFDFGFEFRAELRVAQAVPLADLQERFFRSADLAGRMSPKVSTFYYLALKEDDPLKRFLYLFLTIERQTHAAFKSTDHSAQMAALVQVPKRLESNGAIFFGAQHERWRSLQERFIWCALTVWTHLSDEDLDNFSNVKKVRDQIAHGEIAAPTAEAVALVERIAAKLQLAPYE